MLQIQTGCYQMRSPKKNHIGCLKECVIIITNSFFIIIRIFLSLKKMSGSTSIFELPSDPAAGGNISMNVQEKNTVVQEPMQYQPNIAPLPMASPPQAMASGGVSLDQSTINQIVNGLQQASSTGATLLPSRDIPIQTQHLAQDPHVQSSYIPPPMASYIIDKEETPETMMHAYHEKQKQANHLDQIYDEIQTPLLLAILYFLFQLPILRQQVFRFVPFFFLKDGNPNVSGYLFFSALYGLLFYLLNKSIKNFYI